MKEISILNKLKKLLSVGKVQETKTDEACANNKNEVDGCNFVIAEMAAQRKAEGKIITPTQPAFRRSY